MQLLEIDEVQATAILDLQLRRLAALERQKIIEQHDELQSRIDDYQDILAKPERQRTIVSDELAEIVKRFGDDRRTDIDIFDGDVSVEDLIPQEDVVISITRGGYAKRTRVDLYKAQKPGGKGVRGASLRADDMVEHFFATTSHHWLLFFTNLGRVYRVKAYELPDAGRDAKGMHVANLLAFQPGETVARVLALKTYLDAPYLVLATKGGLVKKTRLTEYDSPRTGGLIAINLRGGDELGGVDLVSAEDDLLLVSRAGMSVRFHATDSQLRPMGRGTSGVTGMKFRNGDSLLAMLVLREGEEPDVFVVFENGMAKRSSASEWNAKGRATLGVAVAKITDKNGLLAGALTTVGADEILVVFERGNVVRASTATIAAKGRNTQGVILVKPRGEDRVVGVARNPERAEEELPDAEPADPSAPVGDESVTDAPVVAPEGAPSGEATDNGVTSDPKASDEGSVADETEDPTGGEE
jgi:DNA gyrase subunit A